jgi:hypothetical protein
MRVPFKILMALLLFAICRTARGGDDSTATAREEFERGLKLVAAGELTGALEAFESAYRTRPHFAVLYNIGQAYASAGRPIEAVATLERFLREGGTKISSARRAEVEQVIAREGSQLSHIRLELRPADAEVWIDGKPANAGETIHLLPGPHVVSARRPGFLARVEPVELTRAEVRNLSLNLVTEPPLAPSAPPAATRVHGNRGLVRVACDVPGVDVSIDGEARGTTPLTDPLMVFAGTRNVGFTRPGYVAATARVSVPSKGSAVASCLLVPDPAATETGHLTVVTAPPRALVTIDGQPSNGRALPFGPHAVRVVKDGFRPWKRTVSLDAGRREVTVLLEPTPERQRLLDTELRRRRIWSVGAIVGGAALGIAAGVVYSWNEGRYRDWRRERTELDARARRGEVDAALFNGSQRLASQSSSIQRVDDITLGMAIVSGSALASGTLFLLSTFGESQQR